MKKFDFKKASTKVAGLSIGVISANLLDKPLANVNPLVRNGGKIVAGVLLPSFLKGDFMNSVGDGMIAEGARGLAKSLMPAMISGDEDMIEGVGVIEEDFTPISGGDYGNDDYVGEASSETEFVD